MDSLFHALVLPMAHSAVLGLDNISEYLIEQLAFLNAFEPVGQ